MKDIARTIALAFCLVSSLLVGGTVAAAGKPETVLITGANRGLGLEFAREFSAKGYKVIGTARTPHEAYDLKAFPC
jgi:NADPH:quinone reductase-like Zn-dependent oxidoreductase